MQQPGQAMQPPEDRLKASTPAPQRASGAGVQRLRCPEGRCAGRSAESLNSDSASGTRRWSSTFTLPRREVRRKIGWKPQLRRRIGHPASEFNVCVAPEGRCAGRSAKSLNSDAATGTRRRSSTFTLPRSEACGKKIGWKPQLRRWLGTRRRSSSPPRTQKPCRGR